MVAGQGQYLKSALLLALNAQKREAIADRPTDGPTDRRTNIVTYKNVIFEFKTGLSLPDYTFFLIRTKFIRTSGSKMANI